MAKNSLVLLGRSIVTTLILEKLYAANNWDPLVVISLKGSMF
jgi:hypothetical protein